MKYYVYVIKCSDGTFYTGIARDINQRLNQHNGKIKGGAIYTRTRQPVELRYSEEFEDRSKALKREYQIKKLTHTEKSKLLPTASAPAASTTT